MPSVIFVAIGFWVAVAVPGAFGADVTLKTHDAPNHTAFLSGTNWSDGAVPAAANDYIAAYNIRTPEGATSYVFGGRSLRLDPGGQLLFKGSNTITVGILLLNGGTVWQGSAGGTPDVGRLDGGITVQAPSFFSTDGAGRSFIIRSSITGDQTLAFTTTFISGTPFTNILTTVANPAFTGPIVVSNLALLVINNEDRLGANPGAFNASQLKLANGGELRISAAITLDDSNRGLTLEAGPQHSGGRISTDNQTVWSWLPITGNGSLTKTAGGTLNLRVISNYNANTYAGGTIVNGGTLNAYTRGALGPGSAIVSNNARLEVFSRAIQGPVVNVYSGTLALSAANVAQGAAVTLQPGGRLLINAPGATNGAAVAWNEGGLLQIARPNLLPPTPITVSGVRMLETYSGPGYLLGDSLMAAIDPSSDGTLGIGANNAVGVLDLRNHPDLRVGAGQNVTYWGHILPNGTAYLLGGLGPNARQTGNTGLSIATLTGAYDVVISATGAVTMLAGNSYSGRTIVTNQGMLVLNSGNCSLGAAPVALQANNIELNNGVIRVHNTVQHTLGPTRGIYLGPSGGDINIWSGSAVLTIDGPISGPGELWFSDAGTAVLSATNTYAGGTRSGTFLRLASTAALGPGLLQLTGPQSGVGSTGSTPVTVTNNIHISNNATFGHLVYNGELTLSGIVNLGGANRTITNRSPTAISGVVSNGGLVLIMQNDSRLTLGDNRIGLGFNAAGAGTVAMAHNNAFGTSTGYVSDIRIQSADAAARVITNWFTIAGGGVTLGAPGTGNLTFQTPINNGTVGKRLVLDGITVTAAGGLTNSGLLILSGSGTLSLGAAGAIPRSTQVVAEAGVTLDASAQASFTRNGGSFEGGGTLLGNLVMQNNARLVPGTTNLAQVLTISGHATLAATTTNAFQIGAGATWLGTADRVDVGGNLTPNSARIQVDPISGLAAGTYTLFTYGGTLSGSFNPAVIGAPGSDVRFGYNGLAEGGGMVGLVVTGSSQTLVWDGFGNPFWDTTNTAAWAAGAERFFKFDRAVFDDDGDPNLTIASVVHPSGIIVSGAQNYVFGGAGRITGWTDLDKTGAGVLTLSTTNDFTGTVRVAEGTLVVNNFRALGADTVGGTVVTNGATLRINGGMALQDERIRLSGSGIGATGALVSVGITTSSVRQLCLDDNTVLNTAGKLEFRGGSARFIEFNGSTLTKRGQDQLLLVDTVFSNRGDLIVSEGVLAIEHNTRNVGDPGNILIKPGAVLALASHGGNPQYAWTNVMQGGIAGNYAIVGMNNSDPTVRSPWRLETDTEFRVTGGAITLSGPVDGTGALLMTNSSGTLYLRGTNLFAGGTIVSSGRLSVAGASIQGLGTGDVDIGNGVGGQLWVQEAALVTNKVTIRGLGWGESSGLLGAIRFSSTGMISGPVILASDSRVVAFAAGDMGEISGPISGNYKLEVNWVTNWTSGGGTGTGAGTITLSGDNSEFLGSVDLRDGTLRLGHDNALGNGTLYMAGGRLVPTGLVARTVPNNIAISNVVRFGGGHPLDRGTLTFNGWVQGRGAVVIEGFNDMVFNGTVAPTGTLTISGVNNVAFNGPIASNAGIIANSAGGTIWLNAANTYTGDTIVAGKNLVLGNVNAIPTGAGRGNLYASGGILDLQGNSPTFNGLGGTATLTDSVGSVSTVVVGNNNATSFFSGALSGSLTTIQKIGNGVFHLPRGLNGAMDAQAGRVAINGNVAGALTLAAGAVVEITGNGLMGEFYPIYQFSANNEDPRLWSPEALDAALSTTNKLVEGASSSAGTAFSFGGAQARLLPTPFNKGQDRSVNFLAKWTGTFIAPTNGTYFFETRSDDASMLWIDDEMVVYNNRYQGATTRGGEVFLTAGEHDIIIAFAQGSGGLELAALLSGAPIPNAMMRHTDLISVGTLSSTAGSILSFTGNVPVRVAQAADGTLAGQLVGAGPMIKDGPGRLTLSANSPYAGTVAVTGGTLRVNGTLGAVGLITVYGGATLDGSGSVRAVTVGNGGTLSPGQSPGILTAAGDVAMESGAVFLVELAGLTPGTQYDQLLMTGSPTLTLNSPTLQVSLGFTPTIDDKFQIVAGFSTLSGAFAGLPVSGSRFMSGGTEFEIAYNSNDITLTVVPEPATLGLLGMVAMAVLLRRRLRD